MIEKMKMVYVVSSLSQRENMLSGLKQLGVLHVAEKKSAETKVSEKFTKLEALYVKTQKTLERQTALSQEKAAARNEIDRIKPWGDFDPDGVRDLQANGIDFHFYLVADAEYQQIRES